MGMREKLIDLLGETVADCMPTECLCEVADHLIANDVVPVVRCKDCKHWKFIDSLNPHCECQIFYGLHEYGYLTGADDFCSYGERKDNERKAD